MLTLEQALEKKQNPGLSFPISNRLSQELLGTALGCVDRDSSRQRSTVEMQKTTSLTDGGSHRAVATLAGQLTLRPQNSMLSPTAGPGWAAATGPVSPAHGIAPSPRVSSMGAEGGNQDTATCLQTPHPSPQDPSLPPLRLGLPICWGGSHL